MQFNNGQSLSFVEDVQNFSLEDCVKPDAANDQLFTLSPMDVQDFDPSEDVFVSGEYRELNAVLESAKKLLSQANPDNLSAGARRRLEKARATLESALAHM